MHDVLALIESAYDEFGGESSDSPVRTSRELFWFIDRQLRQAMAVGPWASSLLDCRNWNAGRILDSRGQLRRPKAYLDTRVTRRGNLVMEWYPALPPVFDAEGTDFLRWWDDSGVSIGEPFHRIMRINDFGHYLRRGPLSEAEKRLVGAVAEFVSSIVEQLRQVVDLELLGVLHLTSRPDSRDGHPRFTVEIRDAEELEEEKERVRQEKWRREAFQKLGIEVEEFLRVFEANGARYAATARALEPRIGPINNVRVRRLATRLYEGSPEFYHEHCSLEPPKKNPVQSVC